MIAVPLILALLAAMSADLNPAKKSLATGDYHSALKALESIPSNDRTGDWYLCASKAWDGLNDPSKAVQFAQAAIERDPRNEFTHLQLAQIFLSRNTPDAAFEILSDAKRIFPESVLIRLGLGLALKDMRRYEESAAVLRDCLRMQPHLSTAFDALGGDLLEMGSDDELIASARQYVAMNTSDYRGHFYLAAGLEKRGAQSDAESAVRRSIELNPAFAASRTLLGKILLDGGNLPGAIEELESATRLRPDYSAAHMYLANAYNRAGRKQDFQRETAELARLNELQSRPVPHLLYHRGSRDHQ